MAQGKVAARASAAERALLLTVPLGITLAPLNSTMIAVAQPRIIAEFAVNAHLAGWLVTGYLIAVAALGPVAGKLGDRLGRRPLFLGGLAMFGAASLAASLAPTFPVLLLFRILQALGGAVAFPNGAALVRELIPAERRATASGLIGAAAGLAAAAGPPLGGLLVSAGWRLIFLVNLPLCLGALALGWWTIPRLRGARRSAPFDLMGAVMLTALLVGGAWALIQGRQVLSGAGLMGLWLALAALLTCFLLVEARHRDPLIDPRLFARRSFASANLAVAASNLAMYVTLLALPLLLRARVSSQHIGLELAALSVASVAFTPLGGRLADRLGRRLPSVIGFSLLTLGLLPLALSGGADGVGRVLGLGLAGIGLGLASAGLQTAALESLSPRLAGTASGVFSTSRYLGSVAGSSLLAGLAVPGVPASFVPIFWIVVGAALLAAVAALGLHVRPADEPEVLNEHDALNTFKA